MRTLIFAGLSAVLLTGAIVVNTQAIEEKPAVAEAVPTITSTQVAAMDTVLAQGTFVTVEQDHATTGTARVIETKGQRYLEFDSEFDTARGPAVQVVLYKGDTVPVNLTEGDYTVVGNLQSFEGTQRYEIPNDIVLEDYEAVAIWCAEFNVTFGYADL